MTAAATKYLRTEPSFDLEVTNCSFKLYFSLAVLLVEEMSILCWILRREKVSNVSSFSFGLFIFGEVEPLII